MSEYKIPRHLSAKTRRFAAKIIKDFDLEAHHFEILCRTAEAMDRADSARDMVAKDGLTVSDRYGTPKAHPAVGIERDARVAVLRGLRELGLDLPGADAPRAPRTRDYGARA
ncbi:P27 family phage terminase small subunit [Mesorhizobium sp. CO1-1-9]|uniref:P27 family phage terminase small subunit n=1 Tax=Mesorhizobium sp. CO1-1-9 TaxID=2876630 RepID=UPI001CCD29A8|nr:P27 family phage terminase small subunit [Mesorhizobium sp. CO1-1-9]MBZ9698813.1 P27 family phage terminase small subunit [Mesorhizobium sp. CO1-1-9]